MLNPTLQGNCFFQLLKRIELEKDYTHLNKLNLLCLWQLLPDKYKMVLRFMKVRRSMKADKLMASADAKKDIESLACLKLVELVNDRYVLTNLGVSVVSQSDTNTIAQFNWYVEDTTSNVGTEGYDEN